MKRLILILLLISFSSCETLSWEQDYNKKSWEIKKKNLELDYLERLYSIRLKFKEDQQIKTIDSLINEIK